MWPTIIWSLVDLPVREKFGRQLVEEGVNLANPCVVGGVQILSE